MEQLESVSPELQVDATPQSEQEQGLSLVVPETSALPDGDAPVDAPIDASHVDPTLADAAAPIDASPGGTAPVDPAPVDPAPIHATPVNTAPINTAPIDGSPVDPAPVDPAPIDPAPAISAQPPEEFLGETHDSAIVTEDFRLKAVLEAIVYVTDEPLTLDQIAAALAEPKDRVEKLLAGLAAEYDRPDHGVMIREVAGGYKMATKPEHHEAVRAFVKNLTPPAKLSLAALETLAVIAYKQPITAPEVMDVRGVQGAGVLKTLLDRKLIATSGRKQVVGKPILYKTTRDFLVQFGLKDLSELPTLKEFEEIRRMSVPDIEPSGPPPERESEPAAAEPPAVVHPAVEPPETVEPQPAPIAEPPAEDNA